MCRFLGAMNIELLLEKCVRGGIQSERWPGYAIDSKSAVKIETAWAFEEECETRAGEFKWFLRIGVVHVAGASGGHVPISFH